MNNQEAKLVLQAYRLDGQDASDPMFHEALEQLKRDPELAKWFDYEQAIESRVQTKLIAALKSPAHLKDLLLAQKKIIRPLPWWRRGVWLSTAAAVLILGGFAAICLKPARPPLLAAFRQEMVKWGLRETGHLSYETADLTQIKVWLKARGADGTVDLPAALKNNPPEGCRVLNWNGQKVTMICFVIGGTDHVDLFVFRRTHFRDFDPSGSPQVARVAGTSTAVWTRGEKTYLLVTAANEQILRKYL